MDEVENAVIHAFNIAARAGKPTKDCYLAAIAIWQAHHPEHVSWYARQSAVRVILHARNNRLIRAFLEAKDAGLPVVRVEQPGHQGRLSSFRADDDLERSEGMATRL